MEKPSSTAPIELRAVVVDGDGLRSEGEITVLGTDRVFLRFAAETAPFLGLGGPVRLEFSNRQGNRCLSAKSITVRRVELHGLRQYEFKFVDPDELWLRHGSDLPDIFFRQRGAAVPPGLVLPVTITTTDAPSPLVGEMRDISPEGMAVAVLGHDTEPLAGADHAQLSFELPGDAEPVSVRGRIRKRSLFRGGHRYSFAFDEKRSENLTTTRKRIDRWVTAEQRRSVQALPVSARRPATTIQARIFRAMCLVTLTFILIVVLAGLHVAEDLVPDPRTQRVLWTWLIGAGVAAGVVSVLLSRGIASMLSRPLRDLTRVSREFAEGNLDAPVPEPFTKELAVLTGSFSRMAERIQLLLIDTREQARIVEQQWAELELTTAKDDFLVIVSHELRTPLTSIISFTDILMTLGKDEEDPRIRDEFLRIIKQQSERLSGLISQLLHLAKIQAGTLQWNVAELDLADLVRRSVAAVIDPRDGSRVRVKTRVPDRRCPYSGDHEGLKHVITNLVDNGRKFSPEGETISIMLKCVDGGYEIWVSDRGRGVKNEDKSRIFQKFVQIGDLLTDRPAGTGLGLSISHEVVHAHGGQIGCRDNNSGRGTVFVVFLPTPDPASPRPVDSDYRRSCARQSNAIAVP